MPCEEVREQFTDYVIESLEEPARSQVAQHLMACASCQVEAGELKTLWTALGSLPAERPSPELRMRFDVMLEAYKHGLDHAPARTWPQGLSALLMRWWPRQPALQLGLALGLLALGVLVGHRSGSALTLPSVQTNSELSELRFELSQMRQLVALSLMQQQSASDRLRGVNWSYQLQEPGREVLTALLSTLMHDPNVNVRLATVDALRQFGDRTVVRQGVVDAMARQESPMVQIALIDLAVELHEKESIATLRRLTQDQKIDAAVRVRAEKGLAQLE